MVELSLTVPITNSLAFLFTVLGDWYVDKKVISRGMFNLLVSHTLLTVFVRYLVWDGIVAWRYRSMCAKQDQIKHVNITRMYWISLLSIDIINILLHITSTMPLPAELPTK